MADKINAQEKIEANRTEQVNDLVEGGSVEETEVIENQKRPEIQPVKADKNLDASDVMKELLEDTEKQIEEPQPIKTELIKEPIEKVLEIKKYLEKPASRKSKKIRAQKERKHEKAYNKRLFKVKDQRSFKLNVMIGLLITFATIMLFKYVLNIDMTSILNTFLIPSITVSGGLIILSFVILLTDRTNGLSTPDPITDYFIINRGKMSNKADKTHMSRINSRFIMVTLLKLFKKQQIAIVNGRIIYGAMDGDISKDEVAILNFMLDHNITTVAEFITVINEEHPGKSFGILGKKDHLYGAYKEAILNMAKEKHYVNQSINKAKLLLRAGAVLFGVIVIALLSKGLGSVEMVAIYGIQAILLFILAHYLHAHSKGAHNRISQLRKERKLLQSNKADVYTAFIYNYLFKKEYKSLKRIQKLYEAGGMSPQEYSKFSETYNGFNYILDNVNKEK